MSTDPNNKIQKAIDKIPANINPQQFFANAIPNPIAAGQPAIYRTTTMQNPYYNMQGYGSK